MSAELSQVPTDPIALEQLLTERDAARALAAYHEGCERQERQRAERLQAELLRDAHRHEEQLEAVRKRAEAAEGKLMELVNRLGLYVKSSPWNWREAIQWLLEEYGAKP
jgi:pyruvate-formate lyase